MCACSHDFVCARCAGTPFDPGDNEPEPITEEAFAEYVREGREVEKWR